MKNSFLNFSTKIFIRFPKTLFDTEDAYQLKKNDLATIIQSRWRGYWQRKQYLKMRNAAVVIQKWVRRFLAQRLRERRRKAADVIRAFIKGKYRQTTNTKLKDSNKYFILRGPKRLKVYSGSNALPLRKIPQQTQPGKAMYSK